MTKATLRLFNDARLSAPLLCLERFEDGYPEEAGKELVRAIGKLIWVETPSIVDDRARLDNGRTTRQIARALLRAWKRAELVETAEYQEEPWNYVVYPERTRGARQARLMLRVIQGGSGGVTWEGPLQTFDRRARQALQVQADD